MKNRIDRTTTTIYDDSVLTLDRAAMHFYPVLSPSVPRVGSIDIISGLYTTRTESTMRFRVCTRPPRPVVHSNANAICVSLEKTIGEHLQMFIRIDLCFVL